MEGAEGMPRSELMKASWICRFCRSTNCALWMRRREGERQGLVGRSRGIEGLWVRREGRADFGKEEVELDVVAFDGFVVDGADGGLGGAGLGEVDGAGSEEEGEKEGTRISR